MGDPTRPAHVQPLTAAASVCSITGRDSLACTPTKPPSHSFCGLQINGQANVTVIREASAAGVPRCAFIRVHDYGFPGVWQLCSRCTCCIPVPCSVQLRGIGRGGSPTAGVRQLSPLLHQVLSGDQGSVLASVCSRPWHDQYCCCPPGTSWGPCRGCCSL